MKLSEEQKQDCREFAENPVAAGITWQMEKLFSRDDKERVPTLFAAQVGTCKIIITCGHIYYPGTWILICHVCNFKNVDLKVSTVKEAAEKTIALCRRYVKTLNDEFEKIKEEKQ